MKCPNCGVNVNELEETCPKCKINFDEYEKEHGGNSETDDSKTTLLKFINILQIIVCGIGAIVAWCNEQVLLGFSLIFSSIVVFAFIKGFYDIIDLLDSINDKIDK